jgi:hypothetical protein
VLGRLASSHFAAKAINHAASREIMCMSDGFIFSCVTDLLVTVLAGGRKAPRLADEVERWKNKPRAKRQ